MKQNTKLIITIIILIFILCSCKKTTTTISCPSEISIERKTIKYSDTKESTEKILGQGTLTDLAFADAYDYNDNVQIVYNKEEQIRAFIIIDKSVSAYNNISVGDAMDKVTTAYEYEQEIGDAYTVLFDESTEMNYTDENKSDDWICITYTSDDNNKIETIRIFDFKYAKMGK